MIRDTDFEEPQMCSYCNGSGEGMFDGTNCFICKGSGTEPSDSDDDDFEIPDDEEYPENYQGDY